MITIVRKRKATTGPLKPSRKDWDQIGKIVAEGIVENIVGQRQASGARIATNMPSTTERKRQQGKPTLSLIDEKDRFIKRARASFDWRISSDRQSVLIFPRNGGESPGLRQLVKYVQQGGFGKRRYLGWFGMHKDTRKKASAIFIKAIDRAFGGKR